MSKSSRLFLIFIFLAYGNGPALAAETLLSSANRIPVIAPDSYDQAANLVDELTFTNLAAMERANLLAAGLEETPWSDTYWPTYAGQLANRYNDPGYSLDLVWQNNFDFLTKKIGQGPVDAMSPAEKYDLLVGDSNFSLTKKMLATGEAIADSNGAVPSWNGLCHGWSASSIMTPRPRHSVTVKAPDGSNITFLPTDLKALSTLLWANGAIRIRFIGTRCNEIRPGKDQNFRETNPACFNTNPATWHLAVVNQIGVAKRSFVMDANFGSEVWNHPVYRYSYSYENPITGERFTSLEQAKVRRKDINYDRYFSHRNPDSEYLVGIRMSVTYATEVSPSRRATNNPAMDMSNQVNYYYDLELDQNDNIIGGEWQYFQHPDFLWVPERSSSAYSTGDFWLDGNNDYSRWDGINPIPFSWTEAAKRSAAKEQPLARIVNRLIELGPN